MGACRTSVYAATAKDEPSSPRGTGIGREERLIRILGPTNDFMPTCAHWCNYSSKLLVSSCLASHRQHGFSQTLVTHMARSWP